MTTSVPELDVDGPAGPPRANGELVFDAPWHQRLFATTMALCEGGTFTYEEFRLHLIAEIDEAAPRPYWWSWQDALERVLAARHVCSADDLAARAQVFAEHSEH